MPKLFSKARDPMSCYTHFIGAVLSVAGIIIMLIKTVQHPFTAVQLHRHCILSVLNRIIQRQQRIPLCIRAGIYREKAEKT